MKITLNITNNNVNRIISSFDHRKWGIPPETPSPESKTKQVKLIMVNMLTDMVRRAEIATARRNVDTDPIDDIAT